MTSVMDFKLSAIKVEEPILTTPIVCSVCMSFDTISMMISVVIGWVVAL
jgi:hypothetical protein